MLLVTSTSSDKIQQIRKNHVAVLYAYSPAFQAIMLSGKISEVLDDETRNAVWNDSFMAHFPGGRDGGDFSVLEFMPETYKMIGGKEKGPVE
jgi:general stress protein 26